MSTMTTLKPLLLAYGACALAFLAMDAVWLTLMNERLYRPAIGELMSARPDFAAAALLYAIYFAGVVFFVVAPAQGSVQGALLRGAFFGLVVYAVYDLTNRATLRGWPWPLTLVDIGWGAFATAVAAAVATWVAARFSGG